MASLIDGGQPLKGWLRRFGEWYCVNWWRQKAMVVREKGAGKPGFDCDVICGILVKEMHAEGLKPKAMHGHVKIGGDWIRHMALELYGRRIDGAAGNKSMRVFAIGAKTYSPPIYR